MRSENEIYSLILETAKNDARIKAVYMNGSRTNINAPKDIFQDYDIVYVVENTQSFIDDRDWINVFGKILYMQYPDENPNYPSDKENSYGYLMQFADGVRIDLTLQTVDYALRHIMEDRLCKILMDKENILPEIGEATDCQRWVKKPAKEQYFAVCNEFWWCTNNIAKGLWRKEIPYVQDMVNYCVRPQLITMLNWKAGILTDWKVSTENRRNICTSGFRRKNGRCFYRLILMVMLIARGNLFFVCVSCLIIRRVWLGKSWAGNIMRRREKQLGISWNMCIGCNLCRK